jgi:hypothetical protein
MNWKRLIATVDLWVMLCLASFMGAGFPAFVVAGLCRIAFKLEDNEAMLMIGLPLFVVLFPIFVKGLPEPLRKANMVMTTDPSTFGPWFKD